MSKLFNPKLFSLLKAGIDKKQISNEIMAGIVVGIVALPLAIAFAVASGVSPDKGLITAIIAGFLIALLGGSRVQIGGPTGAFIIIVYGIVETHGVQGLIISTIMAGMFLVMFGCLKLGALLKYFPHPLIVGFTSGIALVIFSTQVKDALGLDITKVPSDFIAKWELYFTQLHTFNLTALILTVATILISIFSKKITSKIPGSFIAIIGVTLVVQILDLPVTTIESFFGEIPTSIHFSLPSVEWANLGDYVAPAITIAILGAIESLLSAVVADGMIGGNHRSNTELIAQGIANIVTPFFGGIPATGAIARTATNVKNGGRTPIAGMIHAATLLLIMLFFGKWAKLIPMSCLAGVLIVVSYNMSEWRAFRSILKSSAFDIIVLLSTFFLTVLVDLTVAIEVGVVLSALLFMKRMADHGEQIQTDVNIDLIEDYSYLPKEITVYEISGPFFFASAKKYAQLIEQIGLKSKIIVIRMRHVPFIDATGFRNFHAVIKSLHDSHVKIILSGVTESVFRDMKKYDLVNEIGKKHIFVSFNNALEYAESKCR
ncbi:SulP family inorganic anion transporter [Ancylomarina sp. 16SWW S1-10-2]|uniref:SulP family inorganic anion transporter n=1 Tax=Ancylomarina sp. 16SWW S1-10-2 TaxID=2499681 RepID=UPI0012AD3E76|nr:SulP family inorganic anion transporter [Ancylomarina sp. 16SWW S1-10-2]MRT92206.1 STAS domain-containing protein [Ancylomarina sp. 16SWW S1-10-2]